LTRIHRYAQLAWATALESRGDRAQASERAARALELAREGGYGGIEIRAVALIEAQPATPA